MIVASAAAGFLGLALLAGWFDRFLVRGAVPAAAIRRLRPIRIRGWRHVSQAWLPIALLTALAFALRFYHLTYLSLWLDEGGTIQMSHLPWLRVLGLQGAYDTHPPLYYAFIKLVSGIVPEVAAARVVSLVAGTLSVPALYALARLLMNRGAALATATVLALSPLHIWFSQEGRMYAPVLLLVTCSYYALARFSRAPTPLWASVYGWLTLIALYSDYSAAYAIAPQVLVIAWVIWTRKRRATLLVVRAAGALLGFVPWIPPLLVSFQTLSYDRSSYLGVTRLRVAVSLLGITGLGGNGSYYVSRTIETWRRWPALQVPLAILCTVLFIAGLLTLLRRGVRPFLVAVALSVGTVGSAILVSLVSPGYAERVIMAAVLGWALALGALAYEGRVPRAVRIVGRAGILIVLLASTITLLTLYNDANKQDYRGVVRDTAAVVPLGGAVVTASVMDEFFSAYAPRVRIDSASVIGRADAIWFAYGDYSWANIDVPRRQFEDAGYQRALHEYFEDPLFLDLYVKPGAELGTPIDGLATFSATANGWRLANGLRPDAEGGLTVPGTESPGPAIFVDLSMTGRQLIFASFRVQASGSARPRAQLNCMDSSGAVSRVTDSASLPVVPGAPNVTRLALAAICPPTTSAARLSVSVSGAGAVSLADPRVSAAPLSAPGNEPAARTDHEVGTTWRLMLFLACVTVLLFASMRRRTAALAVATLAVAVATPAAPRLTAVAFAFGVTLRDPTTWLALAVVGFPILALSPRVNWDAAPWVARWLPRTLYITAVSVLLVWWYWGGPRESVLALQYLPDLERQATGLVPVILLIGAAMQLILTMLVPAPIWRRALQLDLLASLTIILIPLTAIATAFRQRPQLEASAGVSWVAAILGTTVALRVLTAVRLLLEAAELPKISVRRLTVGTFTIALALSLATASWRAIVLPPGGDEPQYLGATITIWRYGNLDLPAGVFSPEMNRLVASSPYLRDVHLYDDNTRDRLVMSTPLTTSTSLYLPVAGGGGLSATLELLNGDIETAGTRVVFHDATGREVSAYDVVVAPGRQLLLRSPDSNTPLTATITAGKPISVAARLSDIRAGDELYGASRAVPKRCIPLALGAAAPRSEIVIQNVLSSPAKAVVRQLDARGATRAEQDVTVPANGSVAAPLSASGELGAACVLADGPVASLVLTRDNPGLRVQQADSAVSDPVAIPMPEAVQGHRGQAEILLYNPGAAPVEVGFFKDSNDGTAWSGGKVPPGGTARFTGEQSGRDLTHTTGWMVLGGPMVVNVVSTVGVHTTSAAPHTAAATTALLPVLGPQSRRYTDSILELFNSGDTPTLATAKLMTTQGATVWHDKIWVCGHCVETRRVWYQNPVDGVLTVDSTLPVKSTFLQREVVVAWAYHSLGLSLLVLPGYVVAGWGGVLTNLALIAALLASALFGLMLDAGIKRRTAVGATLIASASSPLLTYAAQLYPELAGTLLLIAGLRLLLRRGRWATALGLTFLALVPLVHTRLLPLAILALAASLLPRLVRFGSDPGRLSRKQAAAWLILSIGTLAVLVALAWRVEPRTRPGYLAQYFGLGEAGPHFIGLLFDWASGLLPAFPALIFAGAGLVWLLRGRTAAGIATALLALAPLALVALRRDGWETTPPARYLIPATPFLAVALAAVWDRITPRALRFTGLLAVAWGLAATFLLVWVPRGIFLSVAPLRWYGDDLFRFLFGINPFALFPSLPANLDYAFTPVTVATVLGVLVVATVAPLAVNWRMVTATRPDPAAAGAGTTAAE